MKSLRWSLFSVAAASFLIILITGCNAGAQPVMEKAVPVAAAQPVAEATPFPQLPEPTTTQVEDAVHRVFGDVLVIDRSAQPDFIVGDFNGDGSEDLAVIARAAAGKTDAINNELANWIIRDTDKVFVPPANEHVVKVPDVTPQRVQTGERVLAVIHGFGPNGWRDPASRQAQILKHPPSVIRGKAASSSENAIRALRLTVQSEIIKGSRGEKSGYLFWTGSIYAWHTSGS